MLKKNGVDILHFHLKNAYLCQMGRVLAIDYGRKRTGLAVTDPQRIIASALETVPTHLLMDYLVKYIGENSVDCIVVGMPVQMNGSPSESQRFIRPFLVQLSGLFPDIAIHLADERFTSKLAQRTIIECGVGKQRRRNDKGLVDLVSAVIILQGWMESVDAGF